MTDYLRAETWKEFIGQKHLKERLDVHITAAQRDKRPLEHILLSGPPGFGKTSLAGIIANRLKVELTDLTMPLTEHTLIQMVQFAEGVILLDEIHRASPKEQEFLLPVIESGYIQDRRGRRHYPYSINGFTVVGATTEADKVIAPLYDRFAIKPDFDEYSEEEMAQIIVNMAKKIDVSMDRTNAAILGKATGGIPRVARQFVLAARDIETAKGAKPTAKDILEFCRVTPEGFTRNHLRYIEILRKNGGIAGLKTLQTHLRLSEFTVRELERLLLRTDMIMLSGQGRELSPRGFRTPTK